MASTGTTNNAHGDLLFGGTAPIEQISGTTATFLVANQTGVQGTYGSTGSALELAVYSTYGNQTISSGSKVTPFGFQGSYTDSTGLIYLINRFYDPTTDQFMSIDPAVASTDQPYVFTGDDPLNSTDPLGYAGLKPSEDLLLEYGERYKGGIRGGDFPRTADSNQVLYRVDGDRITSYQVYDEQGLPEFRVDLTGVAHDSPDGPIETPHVQYYTKYTDPDTGKVYVNKGAVETAPDELIPSEQFQADLINGESFGEILGELGGNEGDGPYPKSIFGDTTPGDEDGTGRP